MDYTYESSDPNIVSVDETGGLNAWKAGTATITITAETIGVTKQVTITVDGSQYEDAEVFSKVNLEGAASDNIHLPHYNGGNTGDNTGGNTGGNISWGDGDIDWDWGFDPKPDNPKTDDPQTKPQKTIKVGKPKISLKRSKTKIQVQFKKVKNAKNYQIQYATNKKFKKAKSKTTTKRKYTIKGLKKNKKYYVRVRGVNGKKKGSWSAVKKK